MRFKVIILELPVELQIACSLSRLLTTYWSRNPVPFVFVSSYSRNVSTFSPESHSADWTMHIHTKGGICTQIITVCTECLFGFPKRRIKKCEIVRIDTIANCSNQCIYSKLIKLNLHRIEGLVPKHIHVATCKWLLLKSEFLFLLHKGNLYEDIKSLSKIRLFMFHNCPESSLGISIYKSLGGRGQLGTSSIGLLYTLFLPS